MVAPRRKREVLLYLVGKYKTSKSRVSRLLQSSRSTFYYQPKLDEKDQEIKWLIEETIGSSVCQLGRNKVINRIQRKHPEIGCSQIRRVYEKEGYCLFKRPRRRRLKLPSNPAETPLEANKE